MRKVIFVCTGNICRSPTAEAVFRHHVQERGLSEQYEIGSAGTHGYHVGDAPDLRSQQTAQQRGINMRDLIAEKMSAQHFSDYDVIVAMDQGHYSFLKNMQPSNSQSEVVLFSAYCSNFDEDDVPDPYYGRDDGFEYVFDMIEDGVSGLLADLEK